MTDELIEAVAEEIAEQLGCKSWAETAADRGHLRALVRAGANYDMNELTKMDIRDAARAAIHVIAPAVLEQAARRAAETNANCYGDPTDVYETMIDAIRALKEGYSHDQ